MAELVTQILLGAGWEVRPEVSFSWYGERGVVDLVAWHEQTRTLLLIELKTELVDIGGLLEVTDRRRRLAARIAAPFGWVPSTVAQWVVVAEGRTNRRRLAAARTVVRAAFPSDGRAMAKWLGRPLGSMAVLSFLPDIGGAGSSQRCAPRLRVRGARSSVGLRAEAA
jgi:hypothetical protein